MSATERNETRMYRVEAKYKKSSFFATLEVAVNCTVKSLAISPILL